MLLLQGSALCEQLPYAVNVTFDCRAVSQLPDITFQIGGIVFAVVQSDYAYQVSHSGRECLLWCALCNQLVTFCGVSLHLTSIHMQMLGTDMLSWVVSSDIAACDLSCIPDAE